jgi:hypothetical protein
MEDVRVYLHVSGFDYRKAGEIEETIKSILGEDWREYDYRDIGTEAEEDITGIDAGDDLTLLTDDEYVCAAELAGKIRVITPCSVLVSILHNEDEEDEYTNDYEFTREEFARVDWQHEGF